MIGVEDLGEARDLPLSLLCFRLNVNERKAKCDLGIAIETPPLVTGRECTLD
jgi:hypothetical protein